MKNKAQKILLNMAGVKSMEFKKKSESLGESSRM